jgi:hypothetical protein
MIGAIFWRVIDINPHDQSECIANAPCGFES